MDVGISCPACGAADNAPTAKFCGSCGTSLAAECGTCGHRNSPTSRFCTECGGPLATEAEPTFASPEVYTPEPLAEKIRSARREIAGERKQISVLFADVAGFTGLAERLDPEETHAIMRRCFDIMLAEVHRYEGTVSQFLGDGMLALFGAPIAHEDHAQRAVRAALGIQLAISDYQRELKETRGIDFRMRLGVNSGPVVVSGVGVDLTMDYLAVGDTVNLASRLQSLAEPGTVLISEFTHRLVSGYFVTRDLGERSVKGKDKPILVYEVLRPVRWRSRVDVYAEYGLAPFVGRNREFEILLENLDSARDGKGRVVFVRGEAGIGKSRLLYELRRRIEHEDIGWLAGRCISYGSDIPYLPIVDLVKDSLGIDEADANEDIRRKVELSESFLDSDPRGTPFVKYLLGIDPGADAVLTMDPQLRKAQIFEALRDRTVAASKRRPIVLLIEDLHWSDRLSVEYLSFLADAVSDNRILLALTFRTDWQNPLGTRPYFSHIDLQTLSDRDTAAVTQGLLGTGAVPAQLNELVFRKAEGNPFFAEELTRSLVEMKVIRPVNDHYELTRPLDDVDVPDTVQDVIMARLDRLPDDPRRALQTASVIGREFTVRLLERTADLGKASEDCLRELKTVELIYERSLYPELAYMFKHALTHDVAYNSLLLARRKALHAVVARAVAELYAERLNEHVETLAFHFERAEDWPKAFTYLVASGQKALASFAASQALEFFDRASRVLERTTAPTVPAEEVIALRAGRGQALQLVSKWDSAATSFLAMAEAARDAGDEASEGIALFQAAYSFWWAHRFEDALENAESARALALRTDNKVAFAGARIVTLSVYGVTAELDRAREVLMEAKSAADDAGVPLLQGFARVWEGLLNHWQGSEGSALDAWSEGLELARAHQVPDLLLWLLWTQALGHIGRGEYNEAIASLEEHLEVSARLGDRVFRCRTLNTLGWAYMDLCDWERAIAFNQQCVDEGLAVGDPETIRNAKLNLGDCYLATGDLDAAQAVLEDVERASAKRGTWGEEWMKWRYTQHMNAALGEVWFARGDPRKALEYADKCVAAAEETSAKRNIVKGRRLRADALRTLGRLSEAETELKIALDTADDVGNPAQKWKTLLSLARLREAQGRHDDASAASGVALEVVESVANRLTDSHLRTMFLHSRQVTELRDAANLAP